MQGSVAAFLHLKIKRKQRFQVRRQFQHFECDMTEVYWFQLIHICVNKCGKINNEYWESKSENRALFK